LHDAQADGGLQQYFHTNPVPCPSHVDTLFLLISSMDGFRFLGSGHWFSGNRHSHVSFWDRFHLRPEDCPLLLEKFRLPQSGSVSHGNSWQPGEQGSYGSTASESLKAPVFNSPHGFKDEIILDLESMATVTFFLVTGLRSTATR
jgi:hypothetical protein